MNAIGSSLGNVDGAISLASPLSYQCDVCIVGNGVIGKVAALRLAQAGLDVILLSPVSQVVAVHRMDMTMGWDTRVYALNQVAREMLTVVKVWDALDVSRIAAVAGMTIKGGTGMDAGNLMFDAYSARVDALAWIVEDRQLNQALDVALKFASNVRIVNDRAQKMQIGVNSAILQLASGASLHTTLLVGADGAQSWVRGQCEIGIDYRSYRQHAVVANFATERPHHDIAYQWFTETEGIVALLPLPGQHMSLVWSAPDALTQVLLRESLSKIAERLSAIAGSQLGYLQPLQPEVVQAFPLSLLRTHAIVAPRVALIGDAAHVVHPLAGHGMNLGFGDVAALIHVLTQRGKYRDCGDSSMLEHYARIRKEEILLMQITTDGLERLFNTDFAPVRLMRNVGLNLLDKLPVVKRRLMTHALGRTF